MSPIRGGAQTLLRAWMRFVSTPMSEDELRAPAVVFAPHEDDETLGCGGTILRKRSLGAPVKLVFMTDGAGSHAPRLITHEELARLRETEGLGAARVLGLRDEDVTFLRFRDGTLGLHREEAEAAVSKILSESRPAQVFVPHRRDGLPDHEATYSIVAAALDRFAEPVTLYACPIWFWNHWPWMRPMELEGRLQDSRGRRIRRAIVGALRSTSQLRTRVPVAAQLPAKRRALLEHHSQMTRMSDDPGWPVLADVANGDFLACLMRDDEYFHRESHGDTARGARGPV